MGSRPSVRIALYPPLTLCKLIGERLRLVVPLCRCGSKDEREASNLVHAGSSPAICSSPEGGVRIALRGIMVVRPASEIGVAVTHHLAMVGSRIRVPYFGPCEIGVVEARHSSKVKASDRVRHLAPSEIRVEVNPSRLGRESRRFEFCISDRINGREFAPFDRPAILARIAQSGQSFGVTYRESVGSNPTLGTISR